MNLMTDEQRQLAYQWENLQNDLLKRTKDVYTWALEKGIAKEQARAVLPEGNTKSRMYMNGTLRSWVHYIQLRSGNGTQKEHRDVALACANAIEPIFPMIKEYIDGQS
jgi:thymidylate synthase (FAD)